MIGCELSPKKKMIGFLLKNILHEYLLYFAFVFIETMAQQHRLIFTLQEHLARLATIC